MVVTWRSHGGVQVRAQVKKALAQKRSSPRRGRPLSPPGHGRHSPSTAECQGLGCTRLGVLGPPGSSRLLPIKAPLAVPPRRGPGSSFLLDAVTLLTFRLTKESSIRDSFHSKPQSSHLTNGVGMFTPAALREVTVLRPWSRAMRRGGDRLPKVPSPEPLTAEGWGPGRAQEESPRPPPKTRCSGILL